MQQTEITRRTNKRVMIASFILILLAILGYVMELVRGTRDLSYVLLMSLSLLAPIGFSYIFYRHPKFIEAFKGIALYSFIVSWMIMLSFSPKVIQYVLIFPLLVIYVLYYDYKLIRNASILVFVYGIVKVVLNIRLYGMTDSFMMTEYTVFMLSLIAFGLVAVNTISFSIKIRNQQMESIIAEKEKNAQLLDEMKSVMDVIQKTTKAVHHITNDLMTTSDLASDSIKQLSYGVEEIADSIATQCDRSNDMQSKLLYTTDMSNRIVEKTHQSAGQVHEGKNTFMELDSYADLIKANNQKVFDQMVALEKSAEEIKGVVDVIQKIAVQTNMLALNASIESARAGEAGKGFAVVADSVRELSIRTSESLEGIHGLIDRLESNAEVSLSTAEESLRFGDQISARIHMTRDLFEEIDGIIAQANKEITETVVTTDEVVHNNQVVVDHIAKISQSVKESARAARSVSEKVEHNKALTLKAKAHMDELAQMVERV